MVICHCAGLNDRAMAALGHAATSVESLGDACGAGRDCGSCISRIEAVIDRMRTESTVLVSVSA